MPGVPRPAAVWRDARSHCGPCDLAALDRRVGAEGAKGFRRLKAYKHLPARRVALAAHQSKSVKQVEHKADVV